MESDFLDPPMDCRPHTYWWWPGNAVTKEEITWELEQMHEKGMGGVIITSAAPQVYEKGNIDYLSDEYLEMVRHAILTAKRLGMKVVLNFSAGWAFGGDWIPEEDRSQSLVPAWIGLKGPQKFSGPLPTFEKAPDHRGEIRAENIPDTRKLAAVVAGRIEDGVLVPESLVEITSKTREEVLTWRVPEGQWRIMAFWLQYTGQRSYANHSTLDHFNRAAVERYCDYLGGKFQETFGDEFGKTLQAFHCDSFELANLPNGIYWSDSLLAEFKKYHDYDLKKYLPAIWWDLGEITPNIRYDVSEILDRVGHDAFFRTFLGWCEAHGIQGSMEPIGFPTDVIESAGSASLPMMEITPGEKDAVPWFDTRIGPKKYISSGAHLYGRNVVSVEAYTYIHWELYRTTLEELKIAGDGFFRAGANKFFNHGYSYSPERDVAPSRSIPFAARISHPNVWWKHYPLLAEYVARCSFMLRQGRPAADIAVYSPLANQWTLDVLNARKWTRDFDWGCLGNLLVANGYDFDLLNDDILQNHAVSRDGKIVVRDLDYQILILPNIHALPLATMRFIQRYVREGGAAIVLEQIPSRSVGFVDYKEKDRELQAIASEIFKNRRYGKGFAYVLDTVMDRSDVLDRKSGALDPFVKCIKQHLAPDFRIDFAREGMRENEGLTFVHRKTGGRDIYFVTNIQDIESRIPVTFRDMTKPPWAWNPFDGSISPIWRYSHETDGIQIPLRLAPYESTFLVFQDREGGAHVSDASLDEITRISDTSIEGLTCKNGRHYVVVNRDNKETELTVRVDSTPSPFVISGRWTCCLEGHDFPRIEKTITHLTSWTESADTRNFSGTGRYDIQFELPEKYIAEDILLRLDLGKVGDVAEVWLNDGAVGTRWMRGQMLDITGSARVGKNHLTVYVTNTCINRVSGFENPPPVPEDLVGRHGRGTTPYSASVRGPIGFEPLPAPGLLGPVGIVAYTKVVIPM